MDRALQLASCLFSCVLVAPLAWAENTIADGQDSAEQEWSERVCVGFDEDTQSFGWHEWLHHARNSQKDSPIRKRHCPAKMVFFGTTMSGGRYAAADAPAHGNCCPLPTSDILTDEHLEHTSNCPYDFVVTGVELRVDCLAGAHCKKALRCTKINTKRYQLGLARPGVFWGASVKASFPWKEDKKIRIDQLPPAIRYGLQRVRRREIALSGCVGDPPGSLMVSKSSVRCKGFGFRELQYRGLPGDPERGTPVKMFPHCDSVDDIFSAHARCIQGPHGLDTSNSTR